MKHEHEFVRSYWMRVFNILIQVEISKVNTRRDPDGWVCRICREQGYVIPA